MVVTRPAHITELGASNSFERDVKRAEVINTLLSKEEK